MVTIEELYKSLKAHGASPIGAAGMTGNSVSEVGPSTDDLNPDSELNPEYNEAGCIGLWCWEPVYFDPPRPTGNDLVDMNNQVAYLKANGGFEHATGADAESAGRNFALNYERCAQCGEGALQYVARGLQAAAVARLAAAGNWDADSTPPVRPKGVIRFTGTCDLANDRWTVRQIVGTGSYGNINKELKAEVAMEVKDSGKTHKWRITSATRDFQDPKTVTATDAKGKSRFLGSWDLATGKVTIHRVLGTAHYGTHDTDWTAALRLNITDNGKKHQLTIERVNRHTAPLT